MLPSLDGFEVCREIRKDSRVPIVMLTARADTTDVVVGLELGADDYVTKPFEMPELVARILNWVEAPMDLDDLVNGLTELLGKKDRQYG